MKFLSSFLIFIFMFGFLFACCPNSQAEETKLLTATITKVPQSFYGTWRVASKRIDTDSPAVFKENSLDIWNLSRTFDVITLSNPFNGAKAEIILDRVDTNYIVFTKKGKYGQKILTDTVELKLDGDTFVGTDTLRLDTYADGQVVKTQNAQYYLDGEKIGGGNITEK